MNRPALLLVVLMLVIFGSYQSYAEVKFSLGLKTGLNFSTYAVDPDPYGGLAAQGITSTKSGGTGFQVSGIAELRFSNMFAVVLEPGYAMKSAKWELTQGQAKASDERILGYLQIPILFKAKFLNGSVHPYGFLGPNLGIVLSSKQKVAGFANVADGEYDAKSSTSGMDFGLDFGGGVELAINPDVSLTSDIRYTLGLSNVDSSPAGQGSPTVNSRSLQILFGALFNL